MRLRGLHFFLLVAFSAIASAKVEDSVYLPVKAIPTELNIADIAQLDGNSVADLLAEGLFELGEGFQLDNVLAERVTWVVPGQVLKVKIKEAKFSDGSPLTPIDVVKSLQRCIRVAEANGNLSLTQIKGYKAFKEKGTTAKLGVGATGEHEITIETEVPTPLIVDDLTHHSCSIVKPSSSNSEDLLKGAIGSGPYKVVKQTENELHLGKRTDYHRKNTGPTLAIFRATDNWGDFELLKSWASLIIIEGDKPNDLNFNFLPYSQLAFYYLAFNNSSKPFNDPRLREAISLGADINYLSTQLGWDNHKLQSGFIPFGMAGFRKRESLRNLQKANRILTEKGYSEKNPFTFSILISKAKDTEKEAGLWATAFSGLPVTVRVDHLEQKQVLERRKSGQFEALRISKYPGSVDAHRILGSFVEGSVFNTPKAHEPKCDAIVQKAMLEVDLDKRVSEYVLADKCYSQAFIALPLTSLRSGFVVTKKPWHITRLNQYARKPYKVMEWIAK